MGLFFPQVRVQGETHLQYFAFIGILLHQALKTHRTSEHLGVCSHSKAGQAEQATLLGVQHPAWAGTMPRGSLS